MQLYPTLLRKPSSPWLATFLSSESFAVMVISIAIFTDVLIYTMIIPIIPTALVSRAGVRKEDAQYWVSILLAIYGLALLVTSPILGYFADHYRSRRPPFLFGLLALAISTGLFVIAPSPAALVIARVLQGLSGAVVWVVGLALIVDRVHPEQVGQAMGMTTIAMTVGGFLGPTLGGVMYERLGYYKTFAMPVVLIIIDIVLRLSMLEKPITHAPKGLEYGTEEVENPQIVYGTLPCPDSSSPNAAGDGEGSALLGSTTVTETRSTVIQLLSSARLLVALLVAGIVSVALTAFETTLPLVVMETFHWSSSGAGLIFLAFSLPSFAGSFAGKLVDRFGARRPGYIASMVTGAATISLRLVHNDTTVDKVLLIGLLAIVGLGILLLQIIAMTEVSQVVYEHDAQSTEMIKTKSPIAQAYSLFSMAYAAGQLVGPILAGWIRVHKGWEAMTLIFGICWLLLAVLVPFFSGPTTPRAGDRESDEEHVVAA